MHAALRRCRGGLLGVAGFSAAANVLLLVAPVYMLQIYDRVLPSASHATLIALTGVAVFLLSCFGLLDWVRQRLMRSPLGEAEYRFGMEIIYLKISPGRHSREPRIRSPGSSPGQAGAGDGNPGDGRLLPQL